MRPAGLRAGAGQPLAAEGLRADDGADLVAVDVDVAGMDAVDDVLDARLDARVQAEGQAVALAVDVGDDAVDVVGLEGRDMQHRAEYLALHLVDAGDPEHLRGDEAAVLRRLELGDQPALAPPFSLQ